MRSFLIFLVFFCLNCASITVPTVSVPERSLTIHADTEFPLEERRIIHQATQELKAQVGLSVEIIYDLDFGKVERLARLKDVKQLIRIERSAQLTRDMDLRFRGITFGWTMVGSPVRAYIASDVLKGGETLYAHVVMHELLHIVGCDHVSDPNAVLYWQTDLRHQAVRLTEADRTELLRALTPSRGATGQKH